MRRITVTVSDSVYDEITQLAQEDDLPVATVARRLIISRLRQHLQARGKVLNDA